MGDVAVGERVGAKDGEIVVVKLKQSFSSSSPFPRLRGLVSHDLGSGLNIEAGVDIGDGGPRQQG